MKKISYTFFKIVIRCLAFLLLTEAAAQPYAVSVTTTALPPVPAIFNQAYASQGSGIRSVLLFQFRDSSLDSAYEFKLTGRLERISPSPFSIEFNQSYISDSRNIDLQSLVPYLVNETNFQDAFAGFDPQRLLFTGIAPADIIQQGNTVRLPDGVYRVCLAVYGLTIQGQYKLVSAPGTGCATFTICNRAGSAPQFTQPVNNLNITSNIPVITPTSPVIFTWTPPLSICGNPPAGYRYDFEIRELFENQTVTDAVNNPFVFQKTSLPATTFVLDTNLYRGVLQLGKRYATRVRAFNANPQDTTSLENNGFSRIEAFQYGTVPAITVATPLPMQQPEFYYIPFGQRQTNRLDDVYTAYLNGRLRDTLLPLREYIALNLVQNGIAYNPDAIELFLALNPELAGMKEVRLSNKARLPQFPEIQPVEQRQFDEQHRASLAPDANENALFKRYLDSLNATNYQGLTDTAAFMIRNLAAELASYNRKVPQVNGISVGLVNQLFAELLYNLRQPNETDRTHLRNVVTNMQELMANTPATTSQATPPGKRLPGTVIPALHLSIVGYTEISGTNDNPFLPVEGPLLPVAVVVWRGASEPPARPISSAPELRKAYRVFYTTPALYNHKNPEINARNIPGLASTAQVSLPKLNRFKFWTLNMVNHKTTRAVDIETSDVFLLNNKKKWPNEKKIYVVLKVE